MIASKGWGWRWSDGDEDETGHGDTCLLRYIHYTEAQDQINWRIKKK